MSADYFAPFDTVRYEGPDSTSDLTYRWYDKDRVVLGKRMEEHLRFASCYWHTFCWNGLDPFGGDTFQRPWHSMTDPMAAAKLKARNDDAAGANGAGTNSAGPDMAGPKIAGDDDSPRAP